MGQFLSFRAKAQWLELSDMLHNVLNLGEAIPLLSIADVYDPAL